MRTCFATIVPWLLVGFASAQAQPAKVEGEPAKPKAMRVVISTDFPPLDVIPVKGVQKGDPPERCSDPDDVQSMVRFLLYTNEFDVEALVPRPARSPTWRESRISWIC